MVCFMGWLVSAFVKFALYGDRLVSLFTGRGGDNVYNVVVTASSGAGGRVRTATQSISVTVNDVDEMVSVIPPQDVVLVYRCS